MVVTSANGDGHFPQKSDELWQRVSDFREKPIPVGARPTIRRSLMADFFRSLEQRPGLD